MIPMDASAQKHLMCSAQEQASSIYQENEPRYIAEAQRSIESQLTALLSMLGVEIEFDWAERDEQDVVEARIERAPASKPTPAVIAAAAKRLRISA